MNLREWNYWFCCCFWIMENQVSPEHEVGRLRGRSEIDHSWLTELASIDNFSNVCSIWQVSKFNLMSATISRLQDALYSLSIVDTFGKTQGSITNLSFSLSFNCQIHLPSIIFNFFPRRKQLKRDEFVSEIKVKVKMKVQ